MGFSASWFAVQGKDPEHVLGALGLSRTGEKEEFPDSGLSCVELPGGWFLVHINRFDSPLSSQATLASLSAGCRLVACRVEEHVMYSAATCLEDGVRMWHVEHDAQQDIYHLSSEGNPPSGFARIHAALKTQQDAAGGADADVDHIFEVPVVLAETMTSYRHDKEPELDDPEPFEVLAREVSASSKPWWKFW